MFWNEMRDGHLRRKAR